MRSAFPQCNIGIYPIVDSSLWVKRLLSAGIKCIQLRMKNASPEKWEQEIKNSIIYARKHQAILFVNDEWEYAVRFGADGVHLGQEDISENAIDQIYKAGLYLGLSAYSDVDIERALSYKPSYIAFGPIYSTTSKVLDIVPQGINKLTICCQKLSYPVVAIGGITLESLPDVINAGVAGVAMIAAITESPKPEDTVRQMMSACKQR